MRLTIVLESCFLRFICFFHRSHSLSCCRHRRHVHHFSFFRHFTACGFLSLGSLLLCFFGENVIIYNTGWIQEHMFFVLIYVLFQINESAGDQRASTVHTALAIFVPLPLSFSFGQIFSLPHFRPMRYGMWRLWCHTFFRLLLEKRVEFSVFG